MVNDVIVYLLRQKLAPPWEAKPSWLCIRNVYSVSSSEDKIFAERLQSARQLRELSQSELAGKAGLQPANLI